MYKSLVSLVLQDTVGQCSLSQLTPLLGEEKVLSSESWQQSEGTCWGPKRTELLVGARPLWACWYQEILYEKCKSH